MKSPASKFKAFTLAEILLTLTIIGIVAAITIPTLVNNIQSDQFKVAWKKAYSDISQATQMIMNDNGGTLKGVFSDGNDMKNHYLQYFNYTKSCNDSFNEGCHYSSGKYLNGNTWIPINFPGAILVNSCMLRFGYYSSSCIDTSPNIPICGDIVVDINGFKGPNTMGKDVFGAHIVENGLKAYGTSGDINLTDPQYSFVLQLVKASNAQPHICINKIINLV